MTLGSGAMKAAHRLESLKAAILRGITIGTLNLPDPFLKTIGRSRLKPVDGRSLDLQLAALLKMDELLGDSDPSQHPPAISRKIMREKVRVVASPPRKNVQSRDFEIPGPAGAIPARYYEPDEINPASPLVMYMHGGGWALGDLDTHDSFCRLVASKSNVRVVAIDYRLAPEHPFPAGPDDCVAAFRWLAAHAVELGADPKRIAVMGDSAGGNLSAVIALETREDAIRPVLQVLIYSGTAGAHEMPSRTQLGEAYMLTKKAIDWFRGQYIPEGIDARNPRYAVLFVEDLRGAPPALVYTAGFDPLRDEGDAYADRLRAAGVETQHICFDPMVHGFVNMEGVCAAAADAVESICAEVGRALREQPREKTTAHAQQSLTTG